MTDGITIDPSEMRRLVADLGRVSTRIVAKLDPIIKKGAVNLKGDLNEQAASSRSFKGMAGSVTFDARHASGFVGYEVGPDKSRRGGALGNIFFFGGANGGGGTGDLDGALSREEPELVKALGGLLGGVL